MNVYFIIIQHIFQPRTMKPHILIVLMLPTLCLTNNCFFTTAASYNISCSQYNQNQGTCASCNDGYQFLQGNCYPPCPSGYTQLMPSYCFNSTIINEHQNFTLCPTNVTSLIGNSCFTPSNSTCKCGPPCPNGYAGIGCTCNYFGNSEIKEDEMVQRNQSWLPKFFFILGIVAFILLISYIGYLSWKKKEKIGSSLKQVQAPQYARMVSENSIMK